MEKRTPEESLEKADYLIERRVEQIEKRNIIPDKNLAKLKEYKNIRDDKNNHACSRFLAIYDYIKEVKKIANYDYIIKKLYDIKEKHQKTLNDFDDPEKYFKKMKQAENRALEEITNTRFIG